MDRRDILIYTGNSMSGTFLPGDLLHVVEAAVHDIRPGDVVVYSFRNAERTTCRLVHRAVRITKDGIVAQGDVNPLEDMEFVTSENLVGRVVSYKRNGATYKVSGGKAGLRRAAFVRTARRVRSALKKCIFLLKKKMGTYPKSLFLY